MLNRGKIVIIQNRTVTIYRDNLIFEIQNVTDKLFRASSTVQIKGKQRIESDESVLSQSRYEDTDQNKALMARYIDKYEKNILARLQAYIVRDNNNITQKEITIKEEKSEVKIITTNETKTNDINDVLTGNLTFNLSFAENWLKSSLDLLSSSIHDYLVNGIIFEILRITNPQEALIFNQTAKEAYDNIKWAVSTHKNLKTKGYPFPKKIRRPWL